VPSCTTSNDDGGRDRHRFRGGAFADDVEGGRQHTDPVAHGKRSPLADGVDDAAALEAAAALTGRADEIFAATIVGVGAIQPRGRDPNTHLVAARRSRRHIDDPENRRITGTREHRCPHRARLRAC
jgi:hypothetical protein